MCNTKNITSGTICYPIDGEMSIFFQTDSNKLSRRLQRGEQDILQLKENTRQILDGGQLHDAHVAIIGIESKPVNVNPTNNQQPNGVSVIASSPSNWWIYILITAGIGLLIVLAILVWQKIKNKRNQQNDDYSANVYYEEVLPETI